MKSAFPMPSAPHSLLPNNFAFTPPKMQLRGDGENYQVWEVNMGGLLLHHGVYDVVFGLPPDPGDPLDRHPDRELSYRRALARRIILSGLEPRLRLGISSVAGMTDVPALWRKLEEWFGGGNRT